MDDPTAFVERLMALWREPVPPGDAGIAAFSACYADRLAVNGVPFALADLVTRARALQTAYSGIRPKCST